MDADLDVTVVSTEIPSNSVYPDQRYAEAKRVSKKLLATFCIRG